MGHQRMSRCEVDKMLPTLEHKISMTDTSCSHDCHFGFVWAQLPTNNHVLLPTVIVCRRTKDMFWTLPLECILRCQMPSRRPRMVQICVLVFPYASQMPPASSFLLYCSSSMIRHPSRLLVIPPFWFLLSDLSSASRPL